MADLTDSQADKLDAEAFRSLLAHLDKRKDVQNIDLMILADFCRNCLADWYQQAATDQGIEMDRDEARARIYGMSYSDWKEKHQLPASEEQLAALKARKITPGKH